MASPASGLAAPTRIIAIIKVSISSSRVLGRSSVRFELGKGCCKGFGLAKRLAFWVSGAVAISHVGGIVRTGMRRRGESWLFGDMTGGR